MRDDRAIVPTVFDNRSCLKEALGNLALGSWQNNLKARVRTPELYAKRGQSAEVYANLCPSTRKPRVDGALWDTLG
jgi:hypothetical protein